MPPIYELSATEIAVQIRRGNLSPSDVVDSILSRIESYNDRTNAFTTVCKSEAREAAEKAEHAIADGKPLGPLHGVPIAIKDLDNVAGVRTTFGSRMFEGYVADADDLFVERLKEAGAIVVGKTNSPEFGLGCTTNNLVAGPTGTPFDPDRVAGGSSGGAGAALADRLVPLAQGSDTGGSIRTPASFCGVYGLKPSYGRVPRSVRPNAFSGHTPFSHLGPMARTVEDAALMLDVMAGSHPNDPFSLPDTNTDYVESTFSSVEEMTVAYSPNLGTFPVEPAVRETVDNAVTSLENAGVTVERPSFDLGCTQQEILDAFYTFAKVRWEALFDNLEEEHGLDPRCDDRELLYPATIDTILESDKVTTRDYKKADVVRSKVYDSIITILQGYDGIVTPTLAVPPFKHENHPTSVNGAEIEPLRGWVLTQPFNFSGHPVASVPAGFTDDNLPIGMQIVGRRHSDEEVIALSAAFERNQPWQNKYPN